MYYFSSEGHWRVVSAFQWLPILTDLRSMSLWEADEHGCWILEVTCQQVEIQRLKVGCWRANLLKLPCVVCFLCAPHSATETFRRGLVWLRENIIFLTELFELHCAIDSISGVIKWCLTAWSRTRWFVMHFYFKLRLQTKFHSQTDKEIWIELNRIEVSNNGKWSFFSLPLTVIVPFSVPLSFKGEQQTNCRFDVLSISVLHTD